MNETAMQLFLLINVFLIGIGLTLGIQHALAHFRPHRDAERHPAQPAAKLPPAVREKLLAAAEVNFQRVLDKSAVELERDLKATAGDMNKQLASLGSAIIADEMKRYRDSLDKLREQTETVIGSAKDEVAKHQEELSAKFAERQAEIEAKLTLEMAAEKQRLTEQMDTRLSDAVAAFLTETLQHEVDLGAQNKYLIAMLEEHKAELTKRVVDEA